MTVSVKMVGDILRPLSCDETSEAYEEDDRTILDMEPSFSVRLFPEGFSIGKPLEKEKAAPPAHEVIDLVYPYNRTSESFLRALNGGWIPGDLLEDIPCKYVDGCVACEILDYCVNAQPSADTMPIALSTDCMPVVYKITLRPTTESIVKEVSSMIDEKWNYQDLMEVESRILKTTWPALHLDPKHKSNQVENNSMLYSGPKIFKHYKTRKGALLNRRLRLAASAKATLKVGSLVDSKKVTFEMVPKRLIGEVDSEVMMSGTPKIHEPPELIPRSKLSNLEKRDIRDVGVKLQMKQLKQEQANLDRSQNQADKTALRSGHQLIMDQQHPDAVNSQPPSHGCSGDALSSKFYENTMELMLKELVQHKVGTTTKMAEGNEYVVMEQQPGLSHQDIGKPEVLSPKPWQVLSPQGERDKQDELMHRKRTLLSLKVSQKMPIQELSNEVSHVLPTSGQNAIVFGPSSLPSVSIQPKDKLQVQAAVAGGFGPPDSLLQMQQLSANQQLSRRKASSLLKAPTSTTGVASPGSTSNSGGMASINSPSTANMPPVAGVKGEPSVLVPGPKKEPLENFTALLSVAERYGLPAKKRKTEQFPDAKKISPSWKLLLAALESLAADEVVKDPRGQRNMADSLVGGDVNVCKTRYLQFQRQVFQGSHFRRVHVWLVMYERAKDAMVESVVQFGDDQDDENSVPHHFLPTMFSVDLFANQFCALMEKEGFELVDDRIQLNTALVNAPMNAACNAWPIPAGGSALGNSIGQLASQRAVMNQHMPAMAAVGGISGMTSLHPASPAPLTAIRMPPPGNIASRQFSASYLGHGGPSSSAKPLHLDSTASQLGVLPHQQPHIQRVQQLVSPTQLAQLNHSSAQQLNPQMVANSGQLQQFLQQRQQQHRQQVQTSAVFQRKLMGMGSLGPMGNLGGVGIPVIGGTPGSLGSMVGLNGINNVAGMAGMNNVSASMRGISSLGNIGQLPGMVAMGQGAGLSSLFGQQLHPGNLTASQMAVLPSKGHLVQGWGGRPVSAANATGRNPVENLLTVNTSNQLHMPDGLPMIGPSLSRVGRAGLTPQHAPGTSMGSPKVATSSVPSIVGQCFYPNSQQLSSQQQLDLQHLNSLLPQNTTQQSQLTPPQQAGAQQQQHLQQPSNLQQQLTIYISPESSGNSQLQQQQGQVSPSTHQPNPQQVSSSSQQSVEGDLESVVRGPASPQFSSQNLGTVTSSSM